MPMDGLPTKLPNDPDALKNEQQLARSEQKNEQLRKRVQTKNLTIEKLEERLRALLVQQYGKRSERINPDQLSFLNEAEIIAEDEVDQADADESHIDVKPHKRRSKNKRKPIPEHLARVDVSHELDEQERQCSCGGLLERIGEDVHEQLSIIPRQYFVERHIRGRYACACKGCAKLYRQEKQAAREGLDLPRAKLARWFINGSIVFQPIINRFMDTFFSHDIALCDDTRIRVLKTDKTIPTRKVRCGSAVVVHRTNRWCWLTMRHQNREKPHMDYSVSSKARWCAMEPLTLIYRCAVTNLKWRCATTTHDVGLTRCIRS